MQRDGEHESRRSDNDESSSEHIRREGQEGPLRVRRGLLKVQRQLKRDAVPRVRKRMNALRDDFRTRRDQD